MNSLYEKSRFLCSVLVILCAGFCLLTGCRSYRHTSQLDTIEEHTVRVEQETETNRVDSTATTYEARDTITAEANELGTVTIRRDSTGAPIKIIWYRTANFGFNQMSGATTTTTGSAHASTVCREAADSVATVNQTQTEKVREVNYSTPLEMRIGLGIVFVLVIFYLADYLYRLWKKRQDR